jgi:periplasmic protein TonB
VSVIAVTIEDRQELRRWLICSAVVVAVHAAAIASLVRWHEPIDEQGESGSDTIVLDLTPEREQGAITPEKPIEQPQEEQMQPLPEEDSEVTLPTKPPEPLPKPVETQAPDQVTRAQQVEQRRVGIADWASAMSRILEHNKRYPETARARGEQGIARLGFVVDEEGRLLSSRIIKTSGSAVLDEEALALVQRAQPFPPPPAGFAHHEINVPVSFAIR